MFHNPTTRTDRVKIVLHFVSMLLLWIATTVTITAQSPTFTYQGRLTDGGLPANGVYDFEFGLFDEAGTALATTITREDVAVSNGVFTVSLDFGSAVFNGETRLLEIGVRPGTGVDSFTRLEPRQTITASPYAVRTLTAAQAENATTSVDAQKLAGVAATEYVKTDDPRLVAGPPAAGSPNYIQNGTTTQVSASFNVSGDGTVGGAVSANVVNATTQYNLNGVRLIGIAPGNSNLFVGLGSGLSSNASATENAFFGTNAGKSNTGGDANSFFGANAGADNTLGFGNSFFGDSAGTQTTIGESNSFFGFLAGFQNETGTGNTFVGKAAGLLTRGDRNSALGAEAGRQNGSGSANTFIGANADAGTSVLTNATAIGAGAIVNRSDSLILGNNANVGIGTSSPGERLTVRTSSNSYGIVHTDGSITMGTFVGGTGNGGYIGTKSNHPLHFFVNNGSASMTLNEAGVLELNHLGTGGSDELCLNSDNMVSRCSSSLRYKTNIAPLTSGLGLIKLLQPITFDWKTNGRHDLGLGAEEVARVAPLLVTYNEQGVVEGVKYDRVAVLLVNAVREQQRQIELQQERIRRLEILIRTKNHPPRTHGQRIRR
jgi:hypothetical protein